MMMKIVINDKSKYISFKAKVTKFIVKNNWKRVKKIEIGDYVIVTDPKESLHFLQNRRVIGYMTNGKIMTEGNSYRSAFNNVSLHMEQCQKWNSLVHTMEWRMEKKRISKLM